MLHFSWAMPGSTGWVVPASAIPSRFAASATVALAPMEMIFVGRPEIGLLVSVKHPNFVGNRTTDLPTRLSATRRTAGVSCPRRNQRQACSHNLFHLSVGQVGGKRIWTCDITQSRCY